MAITEGSGAPLPSAAAPRSERWMAIVGATLIVLFLAFTAVIAAWFFDGVGDPSWSIGASMVFPFVIIGWLSVGIPLWTAGITLWASYRRRRRGPVQAATAAWILALAGLPGAAFLLMVLMGSAALSTTTASLLLIAFVVALPLGFVLALAAGAWLIWGRARTVPA